MKICFVIDARSPIAINWIRHFIERDHSVQVISTYPCSDETMPGAQVHPAPLVFSRLGHAQKAGLRPPNGRRSAFNRVLTRLRSGALSSFWINAHLWVTPVELRRQVHNVKDIIARISPDIVHAMRIPFEGMLAARAAPSGTPLMISVWGNDFTLWAANNPLIARQTRQTLFRADALHCDCRRDLDLAVQEWGFDSSKPAVVLPGAGGVQASLFHRGEPDSSICREMNIPDGAPVVFNPRGFRGYVRNDIFFQAIPAVLTKYPNATFVCAAMQGNPIAEKWARRLGIKENVRLLPPIPREMMAELFRLASVAVSPSLHDGTPNTLLEAMACGCFPVAGDIESVREWITTGVNGLLCDPESSESLASSILQALRDEQMRDSARQHNLRLIAERADYDKVMEQAEDFYLRIIQHRKKAVRA